MFIDTKSYVDGNNYVVWYPITVNNEEGIFILHMEGCIHKMWAFWKKICSLNKPIFFCDSSGGAWKHHRQEVGVFDNGNIIYKLKGFKCLEQH